MAVTACIPGIVREGTAEAQRNNLLYEVLGRKYTQDFTVYTDDGKDGSTVVLSSILVPQIGDSYTMYNDSDLLATCVSVTARATKNRKIWVVTAVWDTDRIVSMVTDDPLNQPPVLQWDGQPYERPMLRDVYGVPCVSSSGNSFDPPYMMEDDRAVLRITRNEASFDKDTMLEYKRKLNKLAFAGSNPLFVRINTITAEYALQNGVLFWQVHYELEFREEPDTFVEYFLDQDYRDINGNLFRDKRDAQPLSNQTPLNGRGKSIYDSVSLLQNAMTDVSTTVEIETADITDFPPAPNAPNADGIIVGPHWYFQIRVSAERGIGGEVMEVTAGADTDTFTVTRGYGGTTPVAHAPGEYVTLEPYYLRFIPHAVIDFTPLALPVAP